MKKNLLMKKNHKILRIKVDDRENAKKNAAGIDLVRVWITAPSKEIADACYEDGRKMVIALLEKAKKDRTIVLTTHFMDEADQTEDGMIILHQPQKISSSTS